MSDVPVSAASMSWCSDVQAPVLLTNEIESGRRKHSSEIGNVIGYAYWISYKPVGAKVGNKYVERCPSRHEQHAILVEFLPHAPSDIPPPESRNLGWPFSLPPRSCPTSLVVVKRALEEFAACRSASMSIRDLPSVCSGGTGISNSSHRPYIGV